MKNWQLLLGLCALGLAIVFLPPVNRIVYDPAPPADAMASTVVLDQPRPPQPAITRLGSSPSAPNGPLPPAAPPRADKLPLAATSLLGRQLIITEPVKAAAPRGAVILPAGMPVEFNRDFGPTVHVSFGEKKQATTVAVPRSALANRQDLPPVRSGPLETVRNSISNVVDLRFAPASSIAIEAKEVGTGKGVARGYDSWTGQIDRDEFRTKGLTVAVRNLSRRPSGELEIQVYWTGRRLADNQLHVTHCETFRAGVAGVSEHSETSWSPLLDSNITTWDWNNQRRVSGSKFDGWFVVVTRENQMLVGRGATENYSTILRSPAQLQPLLATWTGSNLHATANRPLWRDERPGKSAIPQDRRGTSTGASGN